jgi:lysophospholipase L1-like esterase
MMRIRRINVNTLVGKRLRYPYDKMIKLGMMGEAQLSTPFLANFSLFANGSLSVPFKAATWSIVSGVAINTPALITNLITNGDMEAGDPPTNYSTEYGGSIAASSDVPTGGGSQSLAVTRGTNNVAASRDMRSIITYNNWYVLKHQYKAVTATGVRLAVQTDSPFPNYTSMAWANGITTARCTSVSGRYIYFNLVGAGGIGLYDNLELYKLNFQSLFAFLNPTHILDVGVKTKFSATTGVFSGLGLKWDSDNNPTSGLVIYYFYDDSLGNSYRVDQCLRGAWSNLSKKAYTSTVFGSMYAHINGTTLYLYYGSTLLDTVTFDASITNNKYNGLFSLAPNPVFYSLSVIEHKTYKLSFIGDSITADVTTGWQNWLVNMYPGLNTITNHAVGGSVIIHDGVHTDIDDQITATASDDADIIIIELGTNDNEGGNMTTLQLKVESSIVDLKASNARAQIFYMNVLPRWTNSGGETVVDKHLTRAAIATACAAQGITCWDTSSWITSIDTSDGLHPTAAGYIKVAQKALSVLPIK